MRTDDEPGVPVFAGLLTALRGGWIEKDQAHLPREQVIDAGLLLEVGFGELMPGRGQESCHHCRATGSRRLACVSIEIFLLRLTKVKVQQPILRRVAVYRRVTIRGPILRLTAGGQLEQNMNINLS